MGAPYTVLNAEGRTFKILLSKDGNFKDKDSFLNLFKDPITEATIDSKENRTSWRKNRFKK